MQSLGFLLVFHKVSSDKRGEAMNLEVIPEHLYHRVSILLEDTSRTAVLDFLKKEDWFTMDEQERRRFSASLDERLDEQERQSLPVFSQEHNLPPA